MTGKILRFEKTKQKVEKHKKEKLPITDNELFADAYADTMLHWKQHAISNSLNQFIRSKLPNFVVGSDSADYVGDLNALSVIEQKIGIKVVIFYPETAGNKFGWLVGFHHGKDVFSAPGDMASEAYARALNILLYIGFVQRTQLRSLT